MVDVDLLVLAHGGNIGSRNRSRNPHLEKLYDLKEMPYETISPEDQMLFRNKGWLNMIEKQLMKLRIISSDYKHGAFMILPDNVTIYIMIDPYTSGRCVRVNNMYERFVFDMINEYGSNWFYSKVTEAVNSQDGEQGIWTFYWTKWVNGHISHPDYKGISSVTPDPRYGPGPVFSKFTGGSKILDMWLSFDSDPDSWNIFRTKYSDDNITDLFSEYDVSPPLRPEISWGVSVNSLDEFRRNMVTDMNVSQLHPTESTPHQRYKEGFKLSELLYGLHMWPGLSKIVGKGNHLALTLCVCDPNIFEMIPMNNPHPYHTISDPKLSMELEQKRTIINQIWQGLKYQALCNMMGWNEESGECLRKIKEYRGNISRELVGKTTKEDRSAFLKSAIAKYKLMKPLYNYQISDNGCRCLTECVDDLCEIEKKCYEELDRNAKKQIKRSRNSPYGKNKIYDRCKIGKTALKYKFGTTGSKKKKHKRKKTKHKLRKYKSKKRKPKKNNIKKTIKKNKKTSKNNLKVII
jgi:hypothetical protein